MVCDYIYMHIVHMCGYLFWSVCGTGQTLWPHIPWRFLLNAHNNHQGTSLLGKKIINLGHLLSTLILPFMKPSFGLLHKTILPLLGSLILRFNWVLLLKYSESESFTQWRVALLGRESWNCRCIQLCALLISLCAGSVLTFAIGLNPTAQDCFGLNSTKAYTNQSTI